MGQITNNLIKKVKAFGERVSKDIEARGLEKKRQQEEMKERTARHRAELELEEKQRKENAEKVKQYKEERDRVTYRGNSVHNGDNVLRTPMGKRRDAMSKSPTYKTTKTCASERKSRWSTFTETSESTPLKLTLSQLKSIAEDAIRHNDEVLTPQLLQDCMVAFVEKYDVQILEEPERSPSLLKAEQLRVRQEAIARFRCELHAKYGLDCRVEVEETPEGLRGKVVFNNTQRVDMLGELG